MAARPQFSMRLDERSERMLEWLRRKLNQDNPGVIRLALARLAEAEGWKDEA